MNLNKMHSKPGPAPRPWARVSATGAGLLLAGCVAVPDVTLSYRHVDWDVDASLVVTLTCDARADPRPEALQATPTVVANGGFIPRYFAHEQGHTLRLRDLAAFYADSELDVEFTQDGRLKSINARATGQAGPLAASLVGAAAALRALGAGPDSAAGKSQVMPSSAGDKPQQVKSVSTPCDVVRARSADKAPVQSLSITYRADGLRSELDTSPLTTTRIPLQAVPGTSKAHHDALASVGHVLQAQAELRYGAPAAARIDTESRPRSPDADAGMRFVPLRLQRMGRIEAELQWSTAPPGWNGSTKLTEAVIDVPLAPTSSTFELPVPRPALFGRQSLSLTLAESGLITSFSWGATSGAAAALDAVTTLSNADLSRTSAEIARLEAESNLIKQQVRAQQCAVDASKC